MSYTIYKKLREKNKQFVLMIQNGFFFSVYQEDALLFHDLFSYQIIQKKRCNKCSFPNSNLPKIERYLISHKISFYVYRTANSIIHEIPDNQYDKIQYRLKESKIYHEKFYHQILCYLQGCSVNELKHVIETLGIK